MRWRVVRQDDNGQVYEVARGLDERAAHVLVEEFEARGHKQLYACEPMPAAHDVLLAVTLTVRRAELAGFRDFEHAAARIMRSHGGAIERAIVLDPDPSAVTLCELHLVRFPDRAAFDRYRADPALAVLRAARDRSVVATEVADAVDGPVY